jgi:hypothetical protein
MHFRPAIAVLAAALFVAAALFLPGPRANGDALDPAAAGGASVTRARLFDRHGEPRLAWDALRDGGPVRNPADTRLAVRLLTELGRFTQADSLAATLPAADDPAVAFLQRLQRARLNLEAGRYARAVDLLSASPPPDPALAAYRACLLAGAQLAMNDPAAAAASLESLVPATIPVALRGTVATELVRALRVLDRTRDALDVTSAAVAATSNSAARRVLMLQQYELAWECDDAPVAIRSARAMFGQYRSSSESATAAADLVNRNATQAISTSALLEAAEVLSAQGDTDDL